MGIIMFMHNCIVYS